MEESQTPGSEAYEDLPAEILTIDQVVAINMRHWRRTASMTQEELGLRLGWSAANVSAAERSSSGDRERRRFDAQTLAELADALDVPVVALLLPPDDDGQRKRYVWQAGGEDRDMAALMRIIMNDTFADGGVIEEYRFRARLAIDAYIPERFREFAASMYAPLDDKEARAEQAARFRSQQAMLLRAAAEAGEWAGALEDTGEEES